MKAKDIVFSLTARILEELSSSETSLSYSSLVLIAGLLLTAVSSFSNSLLALAAVVVFSGVLAFASRKEKSWLIVTVISALFSFIVSFPVYISPQLNFKGSVDAATFIARATASASVFTAFYSYMGWRGLLNGLRGLKALGDMGEHVAFTLRFIPLFAFKADKMLVAREARVFTVNREPTWRISLSIVGDILAASFIKAYWARLAFTARNFGELRVKRGSYRADLGEITIVILAAILIVACLV
ncbi:CbiQ family ECF transporter T component [Infirmifilum uzonense]|uniref:CbiQ family ECF transporter T component n=1 Tax=Infirmifilum uzonense TaxID=1550241 RepID=UPI003C7442F0